MSTARAERVVIGLLLPVLLGLIVSMITRGSVSGCLRVRLVGWPVLLGILGLELVLYNAPVNHQPWALLAGPWIWVATKPLMLAVLARNAQLDPGRRLAWVVLLAGVGLNAVAVAVNGGHMPQSMDAAAAVWGSSYVRPDAYSGHLENVAWMQPSTLLPWLGDVLAEPAWLPRANVLSIGDVVLALGAAIWMFQATRIPRKGTSTSRSRSRGPAAPTISPWAPVVVWGCIGSGLLVLGASLVDIVQSGSWQTLVPFVVVAAVAEILSVDAYASRGGGMKVSLGIAVTIAAAVGVTHGAPLVALSFGLVQVFAFRSRGAQKHLFNLSNFALGIAVAGFVYHALGPPAAGLGLRAVFATLAAIATYEVVNSGLISLVVSLHSGERFRSVLGNWLPYAPNELGVGLIGGCVALVAAQLGAIGALVFAFPLAILRYTLIMYSRQTRRTIQALESQARHDLLTGLPNRLLLLERLQAGLQTSGGGALLLLDLDRFKDVNDTFGHHAGDELLEQIGERLGSALTSEALVARLGGDEFAILLPEAVGALPELSARQLPHLLDQPLLVQGQRLRVGASIGVVHYPEDGQDPDILLRRADVAMYVAKRGRGGVVAYDPAQDLHTPERLGLAGELREAIEQDQLVLLYQPQVDLESGKIIGVEALVRWCHPRRGMITPDEFVAMAIHTGVIELLTRCVLRIALRQCRAWLERGRTLRVAVNVSAHDLNEGFPEVVKQLLERYAVPPHLLQLEITEDAMMVDPQRAERVLSELHRLGVTISIDDFGTGYSSLAYLAQLPIDELKIDRTFVMGMRQSRRKAVIVRSTIGLGHDLGLQVVAEGVEDQATQDFLRHFGCDAFQGYFASRPVAADALDRWLAERSASNPPSSLKAA